MTTASFQEVARRPSVLLVHMPMADPALPNLGMEILAELLRRADIRCDVLYGSLLMPPAVSHGTIHGLVGHAAFTPHYFELDVDQFVVEVLEGVGVTTEEWRAAEHEVHTTITAAEMCLERCMGQIPVGSYDIVGFSAIFDTQKMPSAALAKRLKLREPRLVTLFGGTGCDGEMARALLEHFPEVDAVMSGDAENEIVAAIRFLAAGGASQARSPIANLSIRRSRSALPVQNGMVASLGERVMPDYDAFVEQWRRSPYAARFSLTLMFEASRGCWWGDKHHCEFCGIRQVHEGYRERAAESVEQELVTIFERHRPDLLYAADAILSRNHIKQLLPSLAHYRRSRGQHIPLFFEIKSNTTRKEVALMAAAGITAVQPGIESFSSAVLARVKKGATAIRQIEALKWLRAYDIDVMYGLLVGTPGETLDEVNEMIALIPFIQHLQPPRGVNRLSLHRFSPYFRSPQRFGFSDVRPHRLQELAYRGPRERLMRLCYELHYTSRETEDAGLAEAYSRLRGAVQDWSRAYAGGAQLTLTDSGSQIVILRPTEASIVATVFNRQEAAAYRAIASVSSVAAVSARTALSPAHCERLLCSFAERGLAISIDGAWLGLAVPVTVDPFVDSGLEDASANREYSNGMMQVS